MKVIIEQAVNHCAWNSLSVTPSSGKPSLRGNSCNAVPVEENQSGLFTGKKEVIKQDRRGAFRSQ
ncbi:hypothetical protein [Undibacterium sp.]|uniref:hypothetical protein n=1 Tax=Undibacterium sp. TaxID=1914977 RepID=UPI00272F8A61|nr:hypothetical protein [Undibacterium sp.]MDP1978384.1 hypothetical protein [Undibacterium sp.]